MPGNNAVPKCTCLQGITQRCHSSQQVHQNMTSEGNDAIVSLRIEKRENAASAMVHPQPTEDKNFSCANLARDGLESMQLRLDLEHSHSNEWKRASMAAQELIGRPADMHEQRASCAMEPKHRWLTTVRLLEAVGAQELMGWLGLLVLGLHMDRIPRVLALHARVSDAIGHAWMRHASVPVLPN